MAAPVGDQAVRVGDRRDWSNPLAVAALARQAAAAAPFPSSDSGDGRCRLGLSLSAPAFVVMVFVTAYPLLYAVVLSLYNYRLTDPAGKSFVGLANYATVLTDPQWWMRTDHDAGSPYYRPAKMTREQLREGWMRALTRFYSYSSMWQRFAVNRRSSWIQAVGFWPLNVMQHQLAKHKIVGGMQRFRSGLADDGTQKMPASVVSSNVGPPVSGTPFWRIVRVTALQNAPSVVWFGQKMPPGSVTTLELRSACSTIRRSSCVSARAKKC